jgi:hypothetical protein
MKAARHFVGILVKLTACVKLCHDDLSGRTSFVFQYTCWDASPIILDCDGLIGVNSHNDLRTVARQRFIYGVVHSLKYHSV